MSTSSSARTLTREIRGSTILRMPPPLRTPRLVLEPVEPADVGFLEVHWNDPQVRRYLWDDEPVAPATVEEVVRRSDEHFATFGYGLWLLRAAETPSAVGVCGLRPLEGTGHVELIYSLEPRWWGRGLATEAARAVLAHGLGALGLARIVGGADEPNTASRRVLERLGMHFHARLLIDGRAVPYFGITQEEFPTDPP